MQYPGLRGAANADLTTLSMLSAAAAALFPDFRLSWLYDELRLKLTEELGKFVVLLLDCFSVLSLWFLVLVQVGGFRTVMPDMPVAVAALFPSRFQVELAV